MTKEQVLAEALQLLPQERAELIEDLRQATLPGEVSPEFLAEIKRRGEEIDLGHTELLDGDTVHQQARDMLRRMRAR